MIKDFSIIISSCDKFSDLWNQHIVQLKKFWKGNLPKIYLVTDKDTTVKMPDVEILVFDGDMPYRLMKACQYVDSKYVLITLDDYFLISYCYEKNFSYFVYYMKKKGIDYLSIYNRHYCNKRYYTKINAFRKIDLSKKYAVALYPAIWNKDFIISCIDNDESPWEFEPKLTSKAVKYNAVCYSNNSGAFNILDVVRKGCLLHKANKYFRKHKIKIGNRPLVSWKVEIKQYVADFIWKYFPEFVYKYVRKFASIMGMKFYSEE